MEFEEQRTTFRDYKNIEVYIEDGRVDDNEWDQCGTGQSVCGKANERAGGQQSGKRPSQAGRLDCHTLFSYSVHDTEDVHHQLALF